MGLDLKSLATERLYPEGGLSLLELKRDRADEFCLFVFLPGAAEPSYVLKGSSETARAEALKKEFANLEALSRSGSRTLTESVPAPVFCHDGGGAFLFAIKCLRGHRLKNLAERKAFSPAEYRRILALVVSWILAFYRASGIEAAPPGREAFEALVDWPLEEFRRRFAVGAELGRLLDEARRTLAEAASQGSLPRVFFHGDLSTANVIIDGDRLAVIDWERPLARQLPLIDLYHFIASCRVTGDPAWPREALYRANFETLFFLPGPYSAASASAVSAYAEALGVPASLARPLYVVGWAVMANGKARFLESFEPHGEKTREAADPNRVFPVTFFAEGSVLNLELLIRHGELFPGP